MEKKTIDVGTKQVGLKLLDHARSSATGAAKRVKK